MAEENRDPYTDRSPSERDNPALASQGPTGTPVAQQTEPQPGQEAQSGQLHPGLHSVLTHLIQVSGLSTLHKQELYDQLGLPEGADAPEPKKPAPPPPPSYDELLANWKREHGQS